MMSSQWHRYSASGRQLDDEGKNTLIRLRFFDLQKTVASLYTGAPLRIEEKQRHAALLSTFSQAAIDVADNVTRLARMHYLNPYAELFSSLLIG